jgi:hypothetical protein
MQICEYLPSFLSRDEIYQPDAPKPEDVAVLLEGDEDIDMETLRRKGKNMKGLIPKTSCKGLMAVK